MSFWKIILLILTAGVFAVPCLILGRIIRRKASPWVIALIFAVKVVTLTLLGLFLVYWDSILAWKYNMITGGLYIAVLGSVLADALRFGTEIALRIVTVKGREDSRKTQTDRKIRAWFKKNLSCRSGIAAEAVIIAAVTLYGILNMMIVTPKYWTVTSDKLEKSYKIVFVSDIHTGSAQPFSVLEKTMEDIRKQEPDLLILGGDITDEYSSKEDAERVWKLIGDTGIPAVFVWGNHDLQKKAEMADGAKYTEEEITEIIEKNGVKILADEYLQVGEDLLLFGREDLICKEDRKAVIPADNPSPGSFFLLLEHEQIKAGDLPETGADLQLSGHSHAGQYFPLALVYSIAKAFPSGRYEIGDSELIVSDGASGWRIPLRTQNHCHFEVLELKPEE